MEHDSHRLEHLYTKWLAQTLTGAELEELQLLLEKDTDEKLDPILKKKWAVAKDENTFTTDDRKALAARILKSTAGEHNGPARVLPLVRKWRWVAAASVLLVLVAALYFGIYRTPEQEQLADIKTINVPPGKDGAVLELPNGIRVVLDDLNNRTVDVQHGTEARIKNRQLVYQQMDAAAADTTVYHTVTTPLGRQFQLQLPDGTHVWLNAGSSLKFPVAFASNQRRIELTGEAYFDVAKDKHRPFRVNFPAANGEQGLVEALGTGFNVSAYADDSLATVTLVEGKVRVTNGPASHPVILEPGLLVRLPYGTTPMVQPADTAKTVAWKNGILDMHDKGLAQVMKQLSRWYNIEIEYRGSIPTITFWGEMSRNENLSTVLDFMARSGVVFKVAEGGKKIIIQN